MRDVLIPVPVKKKMSQAHERSYIDVINNCTANRNEYMLDAFLIEGEGGVGCISQKRKENKILNNDLSL